jgi:hypothetical protein
MLARWWNSAGIGGCVAAVALLGLFTGSAETARAAGGSACSSQATSSTVAHSSAGELSAIGIAKWFGDKAAGAVAGDFAGMGFSYLSRITGLDKILPDSSEAKILKQLDEIKLQLSGISERLDKLTESVGQLISEERQYHLDSALTKLCSVAIKHQVLFEQQYVPLVKAATELGQILAGPNPELADVKGPSGFSPRERVKALREDFMRSYENNELVLEGGIAEIHNALVPGSLQTSVLAAYGQVLMTKRFLTRADSELLAGLYSDLAEAGALASWMAAEYRAGKPQNPEALLNVMKTFLGNRTEEQKNLPPVIPPGIVIDLGQVNSPTTNGKPIWFPPSDKDLGWLPGNSQYGVGPVNEVGSEIKALNDPGGIRGSGWAVPTKVQLTALLSEGCVAEPGNPTKFNGACKNAVVPKTGTNVAGYLQRLNPDERTWQQLFCQGGPLLTCAPEAGPAVGGAPPHAFIWTREAVEQKLKCGYTIIPPGQSSRLYSTYTGFRTLANGAAQAAFPPIPEKVPEYGLQNDSIAHKYCDAYLAGLARGIPTRSVPRSPWVSGILLATRDTGADDLNARNGLDYMAQRSPRCDGQLATIVGTSRANKLRGTSGRDVIVARGGDDVVRGLGGKDLVCGGDGDDLLIGGAGADKLRGQRGDDDLRGGPGRDVLMGGRGSNALSQ